MALLAVNSNLIKQIQQILAEADRCMEQLTTTCVCSKTPCTIAMNHHWRPQAMPSSCKLHNQLQSQLELFSVLLKLIVESDWEKDELLCLYQMLRDAINEFSQQFGARQTESGGSFFIVSANMILDQLHGRLQ